MWFIVSGPPVYRYVLHCIWTYIVFIFFSPHARIYWCNPLWIVYWNFFFSKLSPFIYVVISTRSLFVWKEPWSPPNTSHFPLRIHILLFFLFFFDVRLYPQDLHRTWELDLVHLLSPQSSRQTPPTRSSLSLRTRPYSVSDTSHPFILFSFLMWDYIQKSSPSKGNKELSHRLCNATS